MKSVIHTLLLCLSSSLIFGKDLLSPVDGTTYLLSPFDKVSITVYGEDELDSEQLISDDGTVSIPLLGKSAIGGLKVSEAQATIEQAFITERYLVKPVVTINIKEFAPKRITVVGEVEKPGSIEIPPGRNGLAIETVIAEAGGFTGAAKKEAVTVSRQPTEPGGNEAAYTVNVSNLLDARKQASSTEFLVLPDDTVFVPRRMF